MLLEANAEIDTKNKVSIEGFHSALKKKPKKKWAYVFRPDLSDSATLPITLFMEHT